MLRQAKVPYIGLLSEEPREETHAVQARLQLEKTWPECRPQEKAAIINRLTKQGRGLAPFVETDRDARAV